MKTKNPIFFIIKIIAFFCILAGAVHARPLGNAKTEVVIGDRIVVYTNDTNVVKVLKNTYLLDSVKIKSKVYEFYYPKKSETRIITNLGNLNYKIIKQ